MAEDKDPQGDNVSDNQTNIDGDFVQGDKVGGDKIGGNKFVSPTTHNHLPLKGLAVLLVMVVAVAVIAYSLISGDIRIPSPSPEPA